MTQSVPAWKLLSWPMYRAVAPSSAHSLVSLLATHNHPLWRSLELRTEKRERAPEDGLFAAGRGNGIVAVVSRAGMIAQGPYALAWDNSWRPHQQADGYWRFPERDALDLLAEFGRAQKIFWCGPGAPPPALVANSTSVSVLELAEHEAKSDSGRQLDDLIDRTVRCFHKLASELFWMRVEELRESAQLDGRHSSGPDLLPREENLEASVTSPVLVAAFSNGLLALLRSDNQGVAAFLFEMPLPTDDLCQELQAVLETASGDMRPTWLVGEEFARARGWPVALPAASPPNRSHHHRELRETLRHGEALAAVLTDWYRRLRGAFESRFSCSDELPEGHEILSGFERLCILDIEAGKRRQSMESIEWSDVREVGALFLNLDTGMLFRTRLDVSGQRLPASTVKYLLSTMISIHRPRYVVGHNIEGFDLPVLRRLLPDVEWPPPVDTLRLARVLLPGAQSHSMDALRRTIVIEEQPGHHAEGKTHEALRDCWDTLGLLRHLVRRLQSLPSELEALCRSVVGLDSGCPQVLSVLESLLARHVAQSEHLASCGPPVLLHPNLAGVRIASIPSWCPTRETLAAEAASDAANDCMVLLLARELPADSVHTWSPAHHRLCPAAVLRSVREDSFSCDDDTLLGAALLTADADPRRQSFSLRRIDELPDRQLQGLPKEGCGGCPLDQSEACPVQRSARQVATPSGFVAVSPGDARDWAAARRSTALPVELVASDGRWASRAFPSLFGQRVIGLHDEWPELLEKLDGWSTNYRTVPWTALSAKLREFARDQVPVAFTDLWLAATKLEAEKWSERIARVRFGSSEPGPELVVEFSSAGAALSDVFGAEYRLRLLFDQHVAVAPRLSDKLSAITHLAFAFDLPVDALAPRPPATATLPKLLAFTGSRAIGRKSPLRRISYLRDVISTCISLVRRSRKRLVLALSSPPSYWPIDHGWQETRDGWPPCRVVRDVADLWLADRFLGDPAPEGSLLILPAWVLLRDPERISKPHPDGVHRTGCDMVLVDGMPFDDAERHQSEEARFRGSRLGRDPALSYRLDVRWPLSVADVQALAERSPSPVMMLDPGIGDLSGPRGSALDAALQLQRVGDADNCLGVAFHDSTSRDAAGRLLKSRKHDIEALLGRARDLLSEVWGHPEFRKYDPDSRGRTVSQEDILRAIFAGSDTLAVLATGGGKSYMYQVPALLAEEDFDPGLTIVLSPLIALMRDQVDELHKYGIMSAVLVNSSLSQEERNLVFQSLADGSANLLFCAPEQLGSNRMRKLVKERDVALVAVDEAHCISQWGHDFRTEYLQVPKFILKEVCRNQERTFPLLAVTATARKAGSDQEGDTEGDIVKRLELKDPEVFRSTTLRKEISLEILDVRQEALNAESFEGDAAEESTLPEAPDDQELDPDDGDETDPDFAEDFAYKLIPLLDRLRTAEYQGKGLIYCTYAKTTRNLWSELKGSLPDREFDYYHGSRRNSDKDRVLKWFREGTGNQWVIATTAFGMGVNVDDIAHVIHWDLPASMEDYYQQVGRAARKSDKVPNARALMLYDPNDEVSHHKLALRREIDEGMLMKAFEYLTISAKNSRDGTIIVDKDVLAHLVGVDPEGDNIGGMILYYLEHHGRTICGKTLFERLETTAPCWRVELTRIVAKPNNSTEEQVLEALRSAHGAPGIEPVTNKGACFDISFKELAEFLGKDFKGSRRTIASMIQQGFLNFVPVTNIVATENHAEAVEKLEGAWSCFSRLLLRSQVAADDDDRPRPGWPMPRDPKLPPESFFALLAFLQENARRRRAERALPRGGRLRTQSGETPKPYTQNEIDAALRKLKSHYGAWVPTQSRERKSLNIEPLLQHGLDSFLPQEKRRDLAVLAIERLKLCELERGRDFGSGIRLDWHLDQKEYRLDTAPILTVLSERRQLELRKLRLVHRFAALSNRLSKTKFIQEYFDGRLPLQPDDEQDVIDRLLKGDNLQLDESQKALVLDLPLGSGAVVTGLGGSGKTEVLARRYLALVWRHEVPPERVLLLSRRRVTISTLRQRVITLSAGHVRAPQARTVNTLGERLLRQFGNLLPFEAPKKLDVKGCQRQMAHFIEEWVKREGLGSRGAIDRAKDSVPRSLSHGLLWAKQYPKNIWRSWHENGVFGADQDDVRCWVPPPLRRGDLVCDCESLRALAVDYSRWKIEKGLFDLDDQIHIGCAIARYLAQNGLAEELRANWKHVMVDEGQDLEPLAAEFILALFEPHMVFACGDHHQELEVRSSRGARWSSPWAAASSDKVVHAALKRNYRQPSHIMAVAVDVLGDFPEHTAKADSGGRVGAVSIPLDAALPRRLSGMIRKLMEAKELARRHDQIAVICDKKDKADELASALASEGVPVCQVRDRLKDQQRSTAWARLRLLQLWRMGAQGATYGSIQSGLKALLHQALDSKCSFASRKLIEELIKSEPSPQALARALGGNILRRGLLRVVDEILAGGVSVSRSETDRLTEAWAGACFEIATSDREDEGDGGEKDNSKEFRRHADSVAPEDEVLWLQEHLPEYEAAVTTSGRVLVAYPDAVKSLQFPVVFCVWPYFSKSPGWPRRYYVAMSRATDHLILVGSEFVDDFQNSHPETFKEHVQPVVGAQDLDKRLTP